MRGRTVLRNGVRIGLIQGSVVFLEKEIAGVEKRQIAQAMGRRRDEIEFARVGNFVGSRRPSAT